MTSSGLTFGIYPLSVAGTPTGLAVGPQDNYEKIQLALEDLRGGTRMLLPRNYIIYTGRESDSKMLSLADRYLDAGLLGDLTVGCLQEPDLELAGWLDFIHEVINKYGSQLASLQITNEPNLVFMEGSKPYVLRALVEGVIAAKKETRNRNLPIKIGFGSVPDGPMTVPHFWENLAELGGEKLIESLDFVGHNFYVDVFEEPFDLEEIPASVERTLRNLRERDLITGGVPASIPIRVTENGWPTGKNPFINIERSYGHQAKVLETVIRTIYKLRMELNITHYELFGLRDADSSKDDLFHQFGIVQDDYSPKPAYYTYKKLIQELGI
ncbi:hypothetical protein GC093_27145 [Paenibacillus sp. LMG 31456]|uniref:Beta-xylosidase n=1 Tax=Paenibacillus foliorum TaxID=2654974 RepID=A0A972H5R8_9BACL|nr:hypothetical protein [Paenibacillus foliorum]NOU96871.1 hypothetical protein [Paenibacillus foliorum]